MSRDPQPTETLDNDIPQIRQASPDWTDSNEPFSPSFDDVYFSRSSGIDETKYVFIEGNRLAERFAKLAPNECMTVAETGFGTGLNFLCTWSCFEKNAPPEGRLHFLSTELHPLTASDLRRALSAWPQLDLFSASLLDCYPPPVRGCHHFTFAGGRVKLTLCLGDATAVLSNISATVDAWFLDGFSPAKNPQMWQKPLYQCMAATSRPGATVATFTAARAVREGLEQAEFTVVKTSGFGSKRNMLRGELRKPSEPVYSRSVWFQDRTNVPLSRSNRADQPDAIVVGGGLAGCSTAHALAERGWNVTLIEQHNRLAMEASGNPQGILYAKLSAHNTPLTELILHGYLYTIQLLKTLASHSAGLWQQSGVIQLETDDKTRLRQQQLARCFPEELLQQLSPDELTKIAGVPIERPGLWFPNAGWAKPAEICNALATHPNIRVETDTRLLHLERERSNGWQLTLESKTARKELHCGHVIVACAQATAAIAQLNHLPLKRIRGQISEVVATADSRKLRTTLCGEGYAAPAENGRHTIGATFDLQESTQEILASSHDKNLQMQKRTAGEFYRALGGECAEITGGRVAFRCTTPDYLPMVGAVVNRDRFLTDFSRLKKNANHPFTDPPAYQQGLYVNVGHGSRGLVTAPLSGEVLAAQLCGESIPLPANLLDRLNPTRFLVRQIIRNK